MRKEDIAFFSSLMSTYEGVGIVRTLSSKEGVIEVLTTKDMLGDLIGLIDSLKDEYDMQILEHFGTTDCTDCTDFLTTPDQVRGRLRHEEHEGKSPQFAVAILLRAGRNARNTFLRFGPTPINPAAPGDLFLGGHFTISYFNFSILCPLHHRRGSEGPPSTRACHGIAKRRRERVKKKIGNLK